MTVLEKKLSGAKPPHVKDFQNYREFLKAFYDYKKQMNVGFSYRNFARKASIKSPNYLQLVIQGKRNLSESMAPHVADAMGLKAAEKKYFVGLVCLESAKTPEQRGEALQRQTIAMRQIVTKLLPTEKAQVLSHWAPLALRELVFLSDFNPDPQWLHQKLRKLVSVDQCEKIWQQLVHLGFVSWDKNKNQWSATDPVLDTGDQFLPQLVLQAHKSNLKMWAEQLLDNSERHERQLGLINIPLRQDQIPELKKRIESFRSEIIGWLSESENPDTLVQLGTYLLPLTR